MLLLVDKQILIALRHLKALRAGLGQYLCSFVVIEFGQLVLLEDDQAFFQVVQELLITVSQYLSICEHEARPSYANL